MNQVTISATRTEPGIALNELPTLVILPATLGEYLAEQDADSLVVVDSYSNELTRRFLRRVDVMTPYINEQTAVKPALVKVIAIGGCSALDRGRIVATELGLELVAVPTILSTSCISCNVSVVRTREGVNLVKTKWPTRTVICVGHFENEHPNTFFHWTSSGVGDLLSNISASIDHVWRSEGRIKHDLADTCPTALRMLTWLDSNFPIQSPEYISLVAELMHESSIGVIVANSTALSAGCEHLFFEHMMQRNDVNPALQTHGILVAVGTLATIQIYSALTKDLILSARVRSAFRKLRLPTTANELELMGICLDDVLDSMRSVARQHPDSIYGAGRRFINRAFLYKSV